MSVQLTSILRLALFLGLLLALSVSSSLAGDGYTVSRSFGEGKTLCEGEDDGVEVTLQGSGSGANTDVLTVVENLVAPGAVLDLLEIVPGQGGVIGTVFETSNREAVGVFDDRILIEHAGRESNGTNNGTVHNGGDSYTITAETGRDIWAPGDTMEYVYNKFEGDFDVSIRVDDVRHSTGVGCWGKWGIHARQTLESNSRMVQISNHGPKGVIPGATGSCSGAPGQCAQFFARTNHLDSSNGGPNMFEDPPVTNDAADDICFATYLRLKRVGDIISGWVSDDPDVETDPTDEDLWTRTGQNYNTGDGGPCWYVGFANHDHETEGTQVQEIDFSLVKWDGTDCLGESAIIGKNITWSDVTRSQVSSGLTYGLISMQTEEPYGTVGVPVSGTVDDAGTSPVQGPDFVDSTEVRQVGDLQMRATGSTGAGTGSFDGSVYSITGSGDDIWNGGDHMNFMYQAVTGDFDAIMFVNALDMSPGGPYGKYGLMARETCHQDSRYDLVGNNQIASQGNRHTIRNRHRPENDSTGANFRGVVDEELPGAPEGEPFADADFYRLIRTGSQISSYMAYEDPEEFMTPFHWSYVGSRNVEGRSDLYHLGMAMTSWRSPNFNTAEFTLDVQSYSPEIVDPPMDGSLLFERNFDTEPEGKLPLEGFVGVRPADSFQPEVTGGRLKMTDETMEDGASAVWYEDESFADILDTGFVAEWDVAITKSDTAETAGEGGMFVVIASGGDLVEAGACADTESGIIETLDSFGEVVGEDFGGENITTVDNGGTPEDFSDDVYTNVASTAGEIWQNCDDFSFDYTTMTGDFDIAIELISQTSDEGTEWGKQGIMARETLERDSRFALIHDVEPPDHPAHATFRATSAGSDGCDDTAEFATPLTDPPFLRLTRRGNVFQTWVSDLAGLGSGTLNPYNDCNWQAGHSQDIVDCSSDMYVGVINEDDGQRGPNVLTLVYRILSPGGDFADTSYLTELVGYPREMGFGHIDHGVNDGTEGSIPTTGLRAQTEARPMLAVEIDTRVSPDEEGGGKAIEGSGAPENPGKYHIGVNVGAHSHSRQHNEQYGVDADDLPNVFDPMNPVHMKLEYSPNGEVKVFASAADDPETEIQVIDTYIPPLSFGANFSDPILGFVASTIVGGTQTLEFDNLKISRLGGSDGGTGFRRGDCDQSGKVDFNDAIFHLRFLFLGENEDIVNACKDACDSDDSGADDFTDDINILKVLFLGQGSIPEPGPFPDESHPCGSDPTLEEPEELTCESYEAAIECP